MRTHPDIGLVIGDLLQLADCVHFSCFLFSDTQPPQITFSGDLPETTSRNPTLTWSSSEYASFECKLEDGVIFECGSGDDGSWTGSNMKDGTHSLSIRGTDTLGNQGQFISRSWVVGEFTGVGFYNYRFQILVAYDRCG